MKMAVLIIAECPCFWIHQSMFENRYILLNKQILFGEILILWCTKWGFEVKSSGSAPGQTAGYGLGTFGNRICISKMKLIKWSKGVLDLNLENISKVFYC